MNFLVDAQLPPELARWLTVQGHSAQHVFDLDLSSAEDILIWNRALDLDAIIVTKDEDEPPNRNRPDHNLASHR